MPGTFLGISHAPQGLRRTALFLCALTAAVTVNCTSRLAQFYPDVWYAQDRVYQNKTLGFAIMYATGWQLWTDPRDMDRSRRTAARMLQAQGAELLYAGQTAEGAHGTRAIAENLNRTTEDYVAAVRSANAASIERDIGTTTFMAGDLLTVKWEYVFRGLSYAEFIFRTGTYNVRIAFWTTPERYERFLPIFEDVMASLNLRAGL